ncbi:MAG: F0F1 ATP synthase subunit gamma, partial [Oligoflexia bacterium]|nr:F0F1 ATP synthase subunit gamma [Oligoflexia bacterium]
SYPRQELFFIGKKGHDYFKFRGLSSQDLILNLVKEISYPLAAKIAKQLMNKILLENYDGVFIIYNEFKSIITPRIVCERFLPFDLSSERLSQTRETLFSRDILFEVSSQELLDSLLERYFSVQIYRCLCENVAAEHGSRMTAMENATKNAEEVGKSLNLQYNKLRQSSITTELIEIVSGAESLK